MAAAGAEVVLPIHILINNAGVMTPSPTCCRCCAPEKLG
jgi:short-subunit dehydrogenase